MRRLYSICPFGPVRGDMQAWLAGIQMRVKKPLMLKEAQGIFDGTITKQTKRRKRQRPPKTRVTGDKLKAVVLAMGGTVEGQDGN